MAKTSELTELTTLADDDFIMVVDTDDPTMAATGTNKKLQKSNLGIGVKVEIETITLATGGSFSFLAIPQTYKRLIISGWVDSTDTTYGLYMDYNEGGDDGFYVRQRSLLTNFSEAYATGPDSQIAIMSNSSNAATDAVTSIDIVIENYASGTSPSMARCDFAYLVNGGGLEMSSGRMHHFWRPNTAITSVQIYNNVIPTTGVTGELTLYGEL